MTPYIVSQLFAAIAFSIGLYGFFHRNDKHLKLFIGFAAIAMAVHFCLLEAYTGMMLSLVGATRYIISGYSRNTWYMAGFMAFGVIYGALTHQVWSDALPILGNILACYAIFNLSGWHLRACLVVVSVGWVTYNGVHHSVVGMATESFYICANLYNIWRHNRRPVVYKA